MLRVFALFFSRDPKEITHYGALSMSSNGNVFARCFPECQLKEGSTSLCFLKNFRLACCFCGFHVICRGCFPVAQ